MGFALSPLIELRMGVLEGKTDTSTELGGLPEGQEASGQVCADHQRPNVLAVKVIPGSPIKRDLHETVIVVDFKYSGPDKTDQADILPGEGPEHQIGPRPL